MPLGQNGNHLQGFHIRLANGANYNFARVDLEGRGLTPDDVLMELTQ